MDRSFLDHRPVVDAAKNFVCIRLISYEDATESRFIASLTRGDVSNTSFAILTPDGRPALRGRGPARGPGNFYATPNDMARGMDLIALQYPAKKVEGAPELPINLNAKVGLVVAASENQPLALVLSPDPKKSVALEAKLAELAWSKEFTGRFTYATATEMKELPKVKGHSIKEGIVFIEPDLFGIAGETLREVPADKLASKLSETMREALKKHTPLAKSRNELARKGYDLDVYYETGVPVSGRGEARDRERYKQMLDAKKKKD